MFCVSAPRVASLAMIICRLRFVTPFAERLQVFEFVFAAIFEGDGMIRVPTVSWAKLSLAARAMTVS